MGMFRSLRADEIEVRVAQCSEKGVALLLYKDARCDMNILDETVGTQYWMRSHSRDNQNCTVSIWNATLKQWVSKEDTGTESNTEAVKGLASDSFKRACVNWGIGRELYSCPRIFVPAASCNLMKGRNGNMQCRDKFRVNAIEVEGGRIRALNIVNDSKKCKAFTWMEKGYVPKSKRGADGGAV